MKKVLLSVLMLGLSVAYAAPSSETKIGVIDMQYIVQNSAKVKVIKKRLQAQFERRKKSVLAAQKVLKRDMDNLKRNSSVMSESRRASLKENIMKGQRDLRRMEQDYTQELKQAEQKEMQQFFAEFKKVVDKLAAKEGYDLILQKNLVPYASARVDITEHVKKAL